MAHDSSSTRGVAFLDRQNEDFRSEVKEMIFELESSHGFFPGILWFDPWLIYKRSRAYFEATIFLIQDKDEQSEAVSRMSEKMNEYLGVLGVVSTLLFSVTAALTFETFERSDASYILPTDLDFGDDWHDGYPNFIWYFGMMMGTLLSGCSVLFAILCYTLMNIVFVDSSQKMWFMRKGSMGALRVPEILLTLSIFAACVGAAGAIILVHGAIALILSIVISWLMIGMFVVWLMLVMHRGIKHAEPQWKQTAFELQKLLKGEQEERIQEEAHFPANQGRAPSEHSSNLQPRNVGAQFLGPGAPMPGVLAFQNGRAWQHVSYPLVA